MIWIWPVVLVFFHSLLYSHRITVYRVGPSKSSIFFFSYSKPVLKNEEEGFITFFSCQMSLVSALTNWVYIFKCSFIYVVNGYWSVCKLNFYGIKPCVIYVQEWLCTNWCPVSKKNFHFVLVTSVLVKKQSHIFADIPYPLLPEFAAACCMEKNVVLHKWSLYLESLFVSLFLLTVGVWERIENK